MELLTWTWVGNPPRLHIITREEKGKRDKRQGCQPKCMCMPPNSTRIRNWSLVHIHHSLDSSHQWFEIIIAVLDPKLTWIPPPFANEHDIRCLATSGAIGTKLGLQSYALTNISKSKNSRLELFWVLESMIRWYPFNFVLVVSKGI